MYLALRIDEKVEVSFFFFFNPLGWKIQFFYGRKSLIQMFQIAWNKHVQVEWLARWTSLT